MGELHLVTGGARSGKSCYAQAQAEAGVGPRVFVATCQVWDDELRERIARHRADRSGRGWRTIEAPHDLVGALAAAPEAGVVLIDCLTLWVTNLLLAAPDQRLAEDDLAAECDRVVAAARAHPGRVLLVTNEVGLGIVPDNPLARCFRDLQGRCNQRFAAAAERVTLLVCGLPLTVKSLEKGPSTP